MIIVVCWIVRPRPPNGWTSTEVITDTVDDGGLGVDPGTLPPGKFNSENSEKLP